MNTVTLTGNLTRDPELKYTASGTAVLNSSIAVNERRKQGEEWVDDVHFIDLTFWGRTAEVISEYCNKGSKLIVNGRLKQDRWSTDEGQQRSKISVTVENFEFMGGKPQTESKPVAATADDNVPF